MVTSIFTNFPNFANSEIPKITNSEFSQRFIFVNSVYYHFSRIPNFAKSREIHEELASLL